MEVVSNNYLSGGSGLIDQIVHELKSQGMFDQFRRECIADVDTKPAYQNLRQRVEGNVAGFLQHKKWRPDMNKNQVREQLRKNIYESGFLETGVERIVDQVVNPKINSVFLPKVEEVVYRYLGVEKPNKSDVKKEFKIDVADLLPTDLEAVSPESTHTDLDKTEEDMVLSQNCDDSDSKIDEDESPPFEPMEDLSVYVEQMTGANDNAVKSSEQFDACLVPQEDNSLDSNLSGFSGLASHDSNHSVDAKLVPTELSNQDSQLSQNSSDSRLSIVTSDENTKMEVCEDSQSSSLKSTEQSTKENNVKESEATNKTETDTLMKQKADEAKKNDKKPSDSKHTDQKSKSSDKLKSSKSEKDRKDDKDRKEDKQKDRKSSSGKDRSSSKYGSSSRDRKDSKSSSKDKNDKDKSNKDKDRNDKDRVDKDKDKSSKPKDRTDKDKSERDKSKHDKDKNERDKREKEKSSKDKDKDKYDKEKSDREKNEKGRSDKDKSSKDKSDRSDKSKNDKDKISRTSSSSDSSKYRTKSSSSSRKDSDKDKDKSRSSSSSNRDKKSSSDSKSKSSSSDKLKKDAKNSSNHKHSSSSSKKDKDKKSKDDHYSSKDKKTDRRSTDRDSNDGSSKQSHNSSFTEGSSSELQKNSKDSPTLNSRSGDSGNSDKVEETELNSSDMKEGTAIDIQNFKYIKPKFASSIHEVRNIMKIRKQLAKLERQNQLALTQVDLNTTKDKLVLVPKENGVAKMQVTEEPIARKNEETTPEKPLQSTNLSKESWEALEARLAQEMSNVSNSYASPDDDNPDWVEYNSVVISPIKNRNSETKNEKTDNVALMVKSDNIKKNSETKTDKSAISVKETVNTDIAGMEEAKKTDMEVDVPSENREETEEILPNELIMDEDVQHIETEVVEHDGCMEETQEILPEVSNGVEEIQLIETEIVEYAETIEETEEILLVESNRDEIIEQIDTEVEIIEEIVDKNEDDQHVKTDDIKDVGKTEEDTPVIANEVQEKSTSQKTEKNTCQNGQRLVVLLQASPIKSHRKTDAKVAMEDNLIESNCFYLEKPSEETEKKLQYIYSFVNKLEKDVEQQALKIQNNIPIKRAGRKRKIEDMKNNNKANYQEKGAKRIKRNSLQSNTTTLLISKTTQDISSNESFSFPLSPADSEQSNDNKKEEIPTPVMAKRQITKAISARKSQRYSSDDLYKPRPVFSSSRRSRGAKAIEELKL